MNVAAVRQALADVLEAELEGTTWNVQPYVLANPTPPGIQIIPPGRVPHFAVGFDEWMFVIQAFVSINSDMGAQMLLDDLCSSGVVTAALEADKTLGGLVDDLVVTDQSPGRQVEQPPGNPMLLVEWRLTILS